MHHTYLVDGLPHHQFEGQVPPRRPQPPLEAPPVLEGFQAQAHALLYHQALHEVFVTEEKRKIMVNI